MLGKFLFLGTSASSGVPGIGCKCAVCTSSSPRNKRLRPAGLLRVHSKTLLIDAGPDLREQALRYHVDHIDGVMLTHTHFDHIAGLDDLRAYNHRLQQPVPCLLSKESLQELHQRYPYLFDPSNPDKKNCAQFAMHVLPSDEGETNFLGVRVLYTSYIQGGMKVQGFRVGDFAYISDIREYNDSIFTFLQGVQTLILSAVREQPNSMHLSVDEAVAFAQKVAPKQTCFTHLSHALEYETVNRKLPPSIQLGFDGQELEFTYG